MNTPHTKRTYRASELRQLTVHQTGRKLSRAQFYEWLKICLIDPVDGQYDDFDLEKLVFYGKTLKKYRRVEAAKALLYTEFNVFQGG